jgi:hypothetical protein
VKKELGMLKPEEESATKLFEKEPLNSHQLFEIKVFMTNVTVNSNPFKILKYNISRGESLNKIH